MQGAVRFFDATKVEASASLDSVGPRFAIEAHLQNLFGSDDDSSQLNDEPETISIHDTEPYRTAIHKRSVWVEPVFGEGKHWHGLRRFRRRRVRKVNGEALLTATGQNLKRLLSKWT